MPTVIPSANSHPKCQQSSRVPTVIPGTNCHSGLDPESVKKKDLSVAQTLNPVQGDGIS
ncbi:MAG: hypothetical protein IKP51_09225 [Treponema sp.]|nr:hypothetical protein [Treponema sp.]